jgi:hypothetical protein
MPITNRLRVADQLPVQAVLDLKRQIPVKTVQTARQITPPSRLIYKYSTYYNSLKVMFSAFAVVMREVAVLCHLL